MTTIEKIKNLGYQVTINLHNGMVSSYTAKKNHITPITRKTKTALLSAIRNRRKAGLL